MKANKFNSDCLKNAIKTKIKKIMTAKTTQTHFASELLKLENIHRANTTHMAKIISCIKLIENPAIEKATHEKNHFCICLGNITFINICSRVKSLH